MKILPSFILLESCWFSGIRHYCWSHRHIEVIDKGLRLTLATLKSYFPTTTSTNMVRDCAEGPDNTFIPCCCLHGVYIVKNESL